jgi:hypothetical protein
MVQLVSMARDAIALRFGTSLLDKLAHKVRMDRSVAQLAVLMEPRRSHSFIIPKPFWRSGNGKRGVPPSLEFAFKGGIVHNYSIAYFEWPTKQRI